MLSPRIDAILKAALVGLNLVLLNVNTTQVRARLDLTEEREYTLSDVTKRMLRELPDRVDVYGYLSEETHAKLAPLVPKIRDALEEYRLVAGGKLVAHFVDPREDEKAEKQAFQRFDVRPTPFRTESKYESGVRSAYFSIVVVFGDHHAKLGVEDLIEVVRDRGEDVVVRLKNFEYQVTRSIEKVVREFGSLETRLAEQKEPVRVIFYVSEPERVPEGQVREFVEKRRKQLSEIADELRRRFKAGFAAEVVDPAASPAAQEEARGVYGVTPIRASAMSEATLYLDAIVRAANRAERISVRDLPERERSPGEIREAVEASIRRLLPGALRRVGVVGPKPKIPPEELIQYYQRGEPPPGDEFQRIRQALRRGYEVVDVDLAEGKPPLDVDVLLVLKPKDWTEKHEVALDQYLMFGGKAIVCLDVAELSLAARRLALQAIQPKMDSLLERYGVKVRRELVLDDRNVPYPLPVIRDLGGLKIQTVEQVPYPWFLDVRGDSIDRENPVTGSVEALELYWASPLAIDPERTKGLKVARLVTSSERAWTTADVTNIEPKQGPRGGKGYTVPEKTARETVAVAIEGALASGFRDRPDLATKTAGIELVAQAPASTRLVIVGDADFVSDLGAQISPGFKTNVQFLENLVDWALLDDEMIGIRSRGTSDRPLRSIERDAKIAIELANYLVPFFLVVGFGVIRAIVRWHAARRVRPPSRGEGGMAASRAKQEVHA